MNHITPATIDEGLRLLEAFKTNPSLRTFNDWSEWRINNGEALLNACRDLLAENAELRRGLEGKD